MVKSNTGDGKIKYLAVEISRGGKEGSAPLVSPGNDARIRERRREGRKGTHRWCRREGSPPLLLRGARLLVAGRGARRRFSAGLWR